MTRLSLPVEKIKDHYTVVVIGSGYGGGIAASRMARAGQQVCVLERGREFLTGEFPDTPVEAAQELQLDLPNAHTGSRTALFNIHVNEDMNVVVGCGLGGTSLINANVSLRAEPRVYEDPRWPEELSADRDTLLAEGYRRAEEMLKPVPYPEDFPTLPKLQALEKSAEFLKAPFYRPPINVTFKSGVNHVGVQQEACKLCGDCVAGCNHGAKNSTMMNYLPDAVNHGAEIYTQVEVRYVERKDNQWLVHFQVLNTGREKFDSPTLFISADIVVLAAGTLGSTEILLRSREKGLSVSDMVGKRFTGNGDVLGFGYNNAIPIDGIGYGSRRDISYPVGPCITGIIDMRNQPNVNDGMVIEEGSIPGGLAPLLQIAFAQASLLVGKDTDPDLRDNLRQQARQLESLVRGSYYGAVRNTQTYLVMTHDDGAGEMKLENDHLRITWPGVGKQPIFEKVNENLVKSTLAISGTYVKNPIWTKLMRNNLITVHPLGGCCMGEDAERGAVNHKCQVFSSQSGSDVYEGLYVADGSIIPVPLGVNPLLTISALAERCCVLIAQDHGWQIDYTLPSAPQRLPQPRKLGLQFTESMKGYFSTKVTGDYDQAAKQGRADDSRFEFILTIISDDLEEMLANEKHTAGIIGTVTAPALSSEPMVVTDGEFHLFVIDPDNPRMRRMRYRMKMRSKEGKTYYFDGVKLVHNDRGLDMWDDTTTLFITVYDGESMDSPVLGQGILRIRPDDFMRQMTTMQIRNAENLKQRLEANVRFGRFFAGSLFDTYGRIFARPASPQQLAEAEPRKKRPLRTAAPEVYFFDTGDDVQLRLTRYQGGKKGPVLLVHGLGVSSSIFTIDTIETNLVEYLCENGYDVWLLDYRSSIDLPASLTQYNGDDIAAQDLPAAVAQVRELTGAESVQVIAHCFGATTFLMAMLNGMPGVRSAVCSQFGTHVVGSTTTVVKAGLHAPSLLSKLGFKTLSSHDADDGRVTWVDRLYNRALSLYPVQAEERCDNQVCKRINFVYGGLFEHEQINEATHSILHEIFGIASIDVFAHMEKMARAGHLVDAQNRESYTHHLDRLAIPLTFIHGEKNSLWLPESTAITCKVLSNANGAHFYKHHVIPRYGDIDCIFGKNAAQDVYPHILEHLEATNV